MSRTTLGVLAAVAVAAAAGTVAPPALAGPGVVRHPRQQHPRQAGRVHHRSRACVSTRRPCRRSPTPTTARGSRGPRATTRPSTTSCSGSTAAGYTPQVQSFAFTTFVSLGPARRRACLTRPGRPGAEHDPQLLRQRRRDRRGHGPARRRHATRPRGATPPTTPASRSAGSRSSPAAPAPSRPRPRTPTAAGASAVVIANNVAGDLDATLGEGFALDIPVTSVTQAVGAELAAAPGLALRVRDLDLPRPGHDLQRARRDPHRERRQRRDGGRPPRLGQRRARHQRQRLGLGGAARGRRADGQVQPGQHRALRVVGRRGVRPRRLDALRERAGATSEPQQDRALPQLRHGRVAEPGLLRLRR